MNNVLRGSRERIQIPPARPASVKEDDEQSVASGASDAAMKKRASVDMSKEQVEDLVRKLTMDEMKSKWFDAIFDKVKSELVEHPPTDTPSSSEPPSPKSDPIEPSNPHKVSFKATVEDDPEDPMAQSFESGTRANGSSSHQPASNHSSIASGCSPTSSFISESSSRASNPQLSRPKSALVNGNQNHTPNQSPQHSPKSRPSVRFSDRGPVILNERPPQPATRPAEVPPVSKTEPKERGVTLSAVDLKWGKLFDDKGEPTARLGQVLRGIANYLVAEYKPYNSLVVTPEKLNLFYSTYKLESEAFPFQQIFDCSPHGALDNLETLYQHLRCENHLIQRRTTGMPHIPSLTPAGFERWMLCQIQAFPDKETKRLNRVIADLPITADGPLIDGKPERLPKQLSRHLFPAERHRETHDLVVDAITSWIKIADENEEYHRRSSFEDTHKPSSSRDDVTGRYRPDEYRSHDSSKYRRGSRDTYKLSSRADPPSRFVSRINSDSTVRPSKEPSPPPTSSNHRSRSPISNRYRNSTSTIDSSTSANDGYDLVSSGHHRNGYPSSGRRSREKEYRHHQGREPKPSTEATPRSMGRRETDRRSSLILEGNERDPNGLTYDEYMRLNPRAMRNVVVDDGGHYRSPHTSDERTR
ncbi:hypothetical protein FALBO_14719 [Fusarium albosuccineum]|uniref:DUF7514 domain-containing protein n=1 Tax=Fusarium albosuccineum TaxID=1237068 RepID=A0A8H4P485_9HYPO|nr:hypothetical protein FALBO_14719 [Fusarium albosuccineum]